MSGLMLIPKVAEVLACTKRHVYVLIRRGELEAVKVGASHLRVSRESVRQFLIRNRVDPENYFE
jgi:excisionase family DNA binding protein